MPPAEEAAKRAALLAVRRKFFWHSDAATEGVTRQLILDMCRPRGGERTVGGHAPPPLPVYQARPKADDAEYHYPSP